MPGHLLYSTNTRLKLMINETFRGDLHYVWCGDCFDGTKTNAYSRAAMTPPSSDPCAIYRQLLVDVRRSDRHSAKIGEHKLSLSSLATQWRDKGELTAEQAEEMIYLVTNADFEHFRPLLYVIPTSNVIDRLQTVPAAKRASIGGVEYILPDLKRSEFDIVEFEP